MSKTIRLLLADDHALLRQGTAELLRREPDLEVIAEARDGLEAVELARRLKPDIVIIDVRMPVLSGVEATRRICDSLPNVKVLILTAHDDDEYVLSLLQAGASGYLLKTAPASELVKALRQVQEGDSPLDPAIARKLVYHLSDRHEKSRPVDVDSAAEDLTARELEVVRGLARGMSNRAIADELAISDRTVQSHLTNVFAKMQVGSRTEAVLTAIRRGWLTLDP